MNTFSSFSIVMIAALMSMYSRARMADDFDPPQDTIVLENPSFEGTEGTEIPPRGWDACGAASTPDVLPGGWDVVSLPSHGRTFLGLITRRKGTFESVGQRLPKNLKANECYQLSIDLARSPTYAGYNKPIILRIWGGNSDCDRRQLLAKSSLVKHTNWRTYNFAFFPKADYSYLIIEAHFDPNGAPERGNVMLDNMSKIIKCERV